MPTFNILRRTALILSSELGGGSQSQSSLDSMDCATTSTITKMDPKKKKDNQNHEETLLRKSKRRSIARRVKRIPLAVRFNERCNQEYENHVICREDVNALWYSKADIEALRNKNRRHARNLTHPSFDTSWAEALHHVYKSLCCYGQQQQQSKQGTGNTHSAIMMDEELEAAATIFAKEAVQEQWAWFTVLHLGLEQLAVPFVAIDTEERRRRLVHNILYWQDAASSKYRRGESSSSGSSSSSSDLTCASQENDDSSYDEMRVHALRQLSRKFSLPSRLYAHHIAVAAAASNYDEHNNNNNDNHH